MHQKLRLKFAKLGDKIVPPSYFMNTHRPSRKQSPGKCADLFGDGFQKIYDGVFSPTVLLKLA